MEMVQHCAAGYKRNNQSNTSSVSDTTDAIQGKTLKERRREATLMYKITNNFVVISVAVRQVPSVVAR